MMKKIMMLIVAFIFPLVAHAGDGLIQSLEGKVWVNGKLADTSTEIHFGDSVMTGGLSHVTILLDGNVYRIANSSKLTLPENRKEITLDMIYGAILAVFRHDAHKTIFTPTAVLGVRGTGLYLSERDEETHLCACYGDIEFADAANPQHQKHIHAEYHQIVVLDHESGEFSINQKMVGHSDENLHELEKMADRTPPVSFVAANKLRNTVSDTPAN